MPQFKDAVGARVAGGPPAPNTTMDPGGWGENATQFLVPDGAVVPEVLRTLVPVESGAFDADELAPQATDPAPISGAAGAKAAAGAGEVAKNAQKRPAAAPGPTTS